MPAGIELHQDGNLSIVNIHIKRTNTYHIGTQKLHVHYRDSTLILVSPITINALQLPHVDIYLRSLPPPLNKYIYPVPLYAIQLDEEISIQKFEKLCVCLSQHAQPKVEILQFDDVSTNPFESLEVNDIDDSDIDCENETDSAVDDISDLSDEDNLDEWTEELID